MRRTEGGKLITKKRGKLKNVRYYSKQKIISGKTDKVSHCADVYLVIINLNLYLPNMFNCVRTQHTKIVVIEQITSCNSLISKYKEI